MAFSSNFFLFAFLPVVLGVYFATPARHRNFVLLLFSLLFYVFDSGPLIWVLAISIVCNHYAARAMTTANGSRRTLVFVGVLTVNLALLIHFKYTAFLWDISREALGFLHMPIGPPPTVTLPIGISFFTFQAVSYVADVYTGKAVAARRLVDFGMYHALFPQVIAGPIVRYLEIEADIFQRTLTLEKLAEGIHRFAIGLGKKLIIADTLGRIADPIFRLGAPDLATETAWLGLLCYTLQIYFDFSGYSDMAIGLGKMLGFTFPENFNLPYRSQSITEFWRRWHMTLSRWFRDYVYIPLGGNRDGPWQTYRNLFVVFVLCGLWHGAGFTFLFWGLYHGVLLILERAYVNLIGPLPKGSLAWARTFLCAMFGWVLFRSESIEQASYFFKALAGFSTVSALAPPTQQFLNAGAVSCLVAGLIFSLAPLERYSWRLDGANAPALAKAAASAIVFLYSVSLLAANSFNPFIYFRF